jgi:hypothetical protein
MSTLCFRQRVTGKGEDASRDWSVSSNFAVVPTDGLNLVVRDRLPQSGHRQRHTGSVTPAVRVRPIWRRKRPMIGCIKVGTILISWRYGPLSPNALTVILERVALQSLKVVDDWQAVCVALPE